MVDGERMYQASVPSEPSSSRPVLLSEELLIDPALDPEARQNRLGSEPKAAENYRRLVRVFTEVYPWLLLSGRSGISESTPPIKAAR
jgi:hypothetical protein